MKAYPWDQGQIKLPQEFAVLEIPHQRRREILGRKAYNCSSLFCAEMRVWVWRKVCYKVVEWCLDLALIMNNSLLVAASVAFVLDITSGFSHLDCVLGCRRARNEKR
jgi:hypothetical protein